MLRLRSRCSTLHFDYRTSSVSGNRCAVFLYSDFGRQMDEMGAWMAEKGGRSAEKRVQIVVFEGVIVMRKTGY